MLKDPKIHECVIMDGQFAGEIKVNEDCDLILGRTRYGWINRLFGQYKIISFFTLATNIAVVITDRNRSGKDSDDLKNMVWEIVDHAIKRRDKESVIELLFDYLRFMCPDGPLKSRYINTGDPAVSKTRVNKRTHIVGKALVYGNMDGIEFPIEMEFSND